MTSNGKIRKLPDAVVNKIAAGEVIQRPVNVVKELLENSLDAGATQISVTIKNGGLKLIQIQDNGSGIEKSDLEIICHRFTTSKLKEFEELLSIGSFGFRGEALASISHVAELSVITKTPENQCAYKADYIDGKLLSDILPCAGNQGTTFMVKDLFSNMQMRRNALRSPSEEGNKILDVVSRYAVHNTGVAFSLKRQSETGSTSDVRTTGSSSIKECIGTVYGGKLAEELVPIAFEENRLGVKCKGMVTNPNFSSRRFQFLLFINNRLVDCGPMKRALQLVYSSFLPKASHAFVYLSLDIAAGQMDVNVHPTKQEVRFLHESTIVEHLSEVIENQLLAYNQSRTYSLNSLAPFPNKNTEKNEGNEGDDNEEQGTSSKAVEKKAGKRQLYDHELVRTDNREQKLDAFLCTPFQSQSQSSRISGKEGAGAVAGESVSVGHPAKACGSSCQKPTKDDDENLEDVYDDVEVEEIESWRIFELNSLITLRGNILKVASKFLRQALKNHTFVGCIDAQYALIQHNTGLFLTNTERLSEELFYQATLYRFGNFASIRLIEPVEVKECLKVVSQFSEEESASDVLQQHVDVLNLNSAMLKDYFNLEIEEGRLLCLPSIITDYIPQLEGLGDFLWNLAENTDWSTELPCLEAVAKHIAKFYSFKKRYCLDEMASGLGSVEVPWKWVVENILYPSFKQKLFPPNEFSGTVFLKLTDLHDLYKIFERC